MNPVVYLSGTLVDQVRQTKTPGGKLVTNTQIEWTDEDGKTNRAPVKAWGEFAKVLSRHSIGDKVSLECTLQQERWRNRDTKEPRTRLCLVAEGYDEGEEVG